MSDFVHLHVHSHYSLLDGLPKIPDLVANAKKKGFKALALTDHGVMHGVVEFYKEATANNLKPILGVEAYVAPRQLTDKQARLDDANNHLILLAQNLTGYQNLLKLISLAHLQGFYYKPRIDLEILRQYHEGLIALSACFKGQIPSALRQGDETKAVELARTYQTILGENNFYLEIQAHPEMPEQVILNKQLAELGKTLSLPLVATNDVHYLESADGEAQDILVCIQTGKTVDDPNRLNTRGLDNSLKTAQAMRQDLPEYGAAIDCAGEVAERLNVELPLGKRFFPSYPTPQGETPEAYLRLLSEQGLVMHYTQGVPDEVRERLEYELGIIMKKGYASYFLVVADFVNWARAQSIIATTRGSAAGSLTSFLIGITTVNPLIYKLPFERFLNPERPSPPDIDMDFADNRRDEVIAYVTAKYGLDHVAQIVTLGTMAARAAVRDVGRALGYPYSLCDRVAKMIPFGSQGFHMTIERAVNETADLKSLSEQDPQVKRLLELAKKVEGCARHASVHAAGVVIAPTPLTDYCPLQYDVDGNNIITQFDMWSCEDAGLVKMDFLGIRNLSIMGNAINIIKKTKGLDVNLDNLPLNDQKTFTLMSRGETMGMFQLGGSGMTRYLKELKPSSLTDIMAMVALFRPGPMNSIPDFIKRKHNAKLIKYLDPRLKDILQSSYGIITYQDDVLLIAIEIAGYSWEEADKLRKAMGKKIIKEMARQKEKFISGCVTHGLIEAKARTLWELIEPFAAYGFNKAHAASYGIVAYQTAYLKANFPTEFMSAVMTAEAGDLPTVAEAVNECKHLGIEVLPPDINESLSTFTVIDDTKIRFGLSAVKNLGEQVISSIIAERKQAGPFDTLDKFLRRTAGGEVTKKSLESLIKSGALDSLHPERRQLLDSMEVLLSYAKNSAKAKNTKQSSLFGQAGADTTLGLKLAEAPATTKQEKLSWERELIGLYITEHPLAEYQNKLRDFIKPLSDLKNLKADTTVIVLGLTTTIKPITTKRGDLMAFITIEDLNTSVELVVFTETFLKYRPQLNTDEVILVRGKISPKDGEIKIIANDLRVLPAAAEVNLTDIKAFTVNHNNFYNPRTSGHTLDSEPTPSCTLRLPIDSDPSTIESLKQVLINHPGELPVYFLIKQAGIWKKVAAPYKVKLTDDFKQACEQILGLNCLI
ncbi:MAG: DNA polymerase III subunit alpha [Candidatus Kerfeldbacteria bacterium]|nr:DNA polymerase III subunit alpha [Candidatus Kerfeldbacteria bacterium]